MFEHLKRHKNESFLKRLSLTLWVCIFIPFCIIITIYSVSLIRTRKSDIEKLYINNLSNFSVNIDKLLSSSNKKLDFILNYNPLLQVLDITDKQTLLDKVNTVQQFNMAFDAILNEEYSIGVKIYSDNKNIDIPKYFDTISNLKKFPYFDKLENLSMGNTYYAIYRQEENNVYMYRKYNSVNKITAIVEIVIPCSYINKILEMGNLTDVGCFWEFNNTVYDMSTWEVSQCPKMQERIVFKNNIRENDSEIYVVLRDNVYASLYIGTLFSVLFIITAFAVLLFLLTKFIAWLLTQKLYAVTDIIQDDAIQSLDTEKLENDEFGIILRKLSEFYNELKEKTEREKEGNLRMAQLKMNILQERISPHFLYNTLASIKWIYPDKRLGELIDSIVRYYRLMLNSGSSITTIENEIKGIDEYLKIQSFAYAKEVEISVQCEDELKNNKILKNLLQPIVENAFLHGINLSEEPGRIFISIFRKNNNIIFRITNNGPAISDEKLQEINNLSGYGSRDGMHLGYALKNIINRIHIYYGNEYGITASVTAGLTTFDINIPAELPSMPQEEDLMR